MKPRFLAFPHNLVLTSSAMMAVLSPLSTFAADYTWKGTTDSDWETGGNWLLGVAPTYGSDLSADRLYMGSGGANAGAVYNPGAGVTTTFGSGRGIIIGSAQGPANLTVSSGTLKINGPGTSGNEPIMANGVSATLLINGGHLDLSGHGNGFRLVNTGATGLTSDLTIGSGTFSCGTFDFFSAGVAASSSVNLDGGVMAVTRFLKASTAATSTLNLDGGTLRLRSTQTTSPNFTLPDLTGLTTTIEDGGVIVDTNTFSGTLAEVLEHDATLGATQDGGLTKNGAGTLNLSGANTFTGGLTINAGTDLTPNFSRVALSNDSAAGSGAITMAGSFSELRISGAGRNIANAITISNTGDEKTLIFTDSGSATCSGDITINETNIDHFRVRTDSSTLTFSGKISGAGGINKYSGGAVVELTNSANDFTGGAKLTVGTLGFSTDALGTAGSIIMDGGSLRWAASNDQDMSSRLVMVDGKTATLNLAEQFTPSYDVANVTFASGIGNSSTAALVKTGPGQLTLTQPSTYSGGTTLSQGTLEFSNDGLGTAGSVTMNGAILRWGTGNTQDISSRIVMVDAKTASFSTNGNDVTFATAFGNSSTGNLAKTTTSGILTLTGANTYTGTTSVGGGTLRVNGSLDAASAVTVTGGDLGGSGTIGGSVTVAAAGNVAPGASAGTLTIGGGLDISAMAAGTGKLKFELDALAGTNDLLAVGGALTLGAGDLGIDNLAITNLGGLQAGTYTLITSTGLSGTVNGAVAEIATGFNGQLQVSGNNLQLVVTAASGGYAAWQAANSTAGGLNEDHDGDGVDNGTEYFLFGSASSTGFTALPGVNGNSVTWTKAATGYDGAYNTDFFVETSDTLAAGSWVTAAEGTGADKVEITGNNVKYTFPTGSKKFARLKVTGP